MLSIDSDAVADRERVGYRFAGHNADGPFVVEQQAYLSERDGRIDWMRVICFRALRSPERAQSCEVSLGRPSSSRPVSSSVERDTSMCCVAACTSRKRRWSGLVA